jgi:hypothetical protein
VSPGQLAVTALFAVALAGLVFTLLLAWAYWPVIA